MRPTASILSYLLALTGALVLAGCPTGDDDDSSGSDDDDTAVDDDDTAVDDDDTAADDDDTAVDDDDTADDDDSTPIDYGEPPTATVTLVPASPSSDDVLLASITTSDPESMPVTVSIRWTVDGSPAPAYDNSTIVPGGATSAGEVWAVEVLPNDGGQDGAPATDSVTIGNQPPVLYAVSILPLAPAEGDDVVATPGGTSDPEGDAVTVSVAWFVNGVDSGVTGNTLTSADFDKGDAIHAVATPNDGSADGGAVTSNTVTAVNTAPTATGATVDPAAGFEDTVFTCSGEGFADVDGDAEGWLYTWVINGIFNVPGASLDGASFNRGDYLVCQAWATDGALASAMVSSAPLLVGNTAPTLAGATITPDPATSSNALTAVPGLAADIDDDTVSFSYAWTVDGAPAGGDMPVLAASEFARADAVAVEVTPWDGTDAGVPVLSASVTIGNSAPAFTGVELVYDVASDSYLASGLGWSDADGDAEGYVYAWANSAGALGETGSVLASASLTAPDTVTVTLTADDGTELGNTLSSATQDFGPMAEMSPPRMDFGEVNLGCEPTGGLVVHNAGTTLLTITAITLTETVGSGYFTVPVAGAVPILVGPSGSVTIEVNYDAFDESEAAADLEVVTNDPATPSVVVPITASSRLGDIYEEQFVGYWDIHPYELEYVPAVEITEIDHDYDFPFTGFIYDPVLNTMDMDESISTGELTIIRYVPLGVGCVDNLAPIVVASLVPSTPAACVATEIDTSGSYDPDGDAFDFRFDMLAAPAGSDVGGDFVSQTADTVSVLTDLAGDYELAISGRDEHGAEGEAVSVLFTGADATAAGSNSPVADAGPDVAASGSGRCFEAAYGSLDCTECFAEAVRLDGTASVDPDGTGLVYSWSPSGSDLEILEGGDSATPLVGLPDGVDDMPGIFVEYSDTFELTVTDCDGLSDTTTVEVIITCTAPPAVNVGPPVQDE